MRRLYARLVPIGVLDRRALREPLRAADIWARAVTGGQMLTAMVVKIDHADIDTWLQASGAPRWKSLPGDKA